jgi:hypothetical protein
MQLPIQARPIVRGVSSAKISRALMSGVTASEGCDWGKCGWMLPVCLVATPGGPLAVAGCLTAIAGTECRDCIGEMVNNLMSGAGGHGGGAPGRDHYDPIM